MEQVAVFGLLFFCGVVAGTLNVLAGGGSFITLPVLIFLGLTPSVANGTNRIGILLQNVSAVWGFNRHGIIDWRYVLWAAAPATVGAVVGSTLALEVGDQNFKRILAFIMVAVTLWTLIDPLKMGQKVQEGEEAKPNPLKLGAGFFVVGIYGGFVQAGVGFLILTATTLAGLDLVRGNAVKVLSVLFYTGIALAVFAMNDAVDWPKGLALAAGTIIGGQLGVRLTVKKGHGWIKGFVTVTVIVFALKLWLE